MKRIAPHMPAAVHAVAPVVARVAVCALAAATMAPAAMAKPMLPTLTTDIVSQDTMVAIAAPLGASPLHRRLDVAYINLDRDMGTIDGLGAARLGVSFQYGSMFSANPNDFIGHETDHHSLRINREIYLGLTGSVAMPHGWTLVAGAGALRTDIHNGFDDSTHQWQRANVTLTGWRFNVGAQHWLGRSRATVGWQMTRYPYARSLDVTSPEQGSSSRWGLEIVTPY